MAPVPSHPNPGAGAVAESDAVHSYGGVSNDEQTRLRMLAESRPEFTFAPLVGVRYQSKKVVDYHYGVKNGEATSTRKQYSGTSATTPYVGIESKINLTKHFSLNADVVYERRDKSIKNSSLTNNDDHDVVANIGLTYWF